MRLSKVLAQSVLLFLVGSFLTACGGGSPKTTPQQPLTITTSTLTQAIVNLPYTLYLQASGGTGTYTWSISAGSLPAGLTFNSQQGLISGTPTVSGTFNFTAKVVDSANNQATANLSLPVQGALLISCPSCSPSGSTNLPTANPGTPYSATVSVSGGVAPYTWCVVESSGTCDNGSGGGLPPGLTISTDSNGNGIISGTPTAAGPPQITLQVSDSETIPARGSADFTLSLFGITNASLPNGTVHQPYSTSLTLVGGTAPFTFSLANNTTLPPGLSLAQCTKTVHPSCTISGDPTQTGTTQFTVQVTDNENPPATASTTLSITIGALVSNTTLSGNYAFGFTGYSSNNIASNNPSGFFIMAGSFIADGQGNITGGKIDVNNGMGEPNNPTLCSGNPNCPIAQTIQPGSKYDLSTNGNGLGSMTIMTLDNQGTPYTYNFQIAVSGTQNACTKNTGLSACGQLIESDTQSYGSGILKVQDSQFFFTGAFFPGNFAMLVNGLDPSGNRYAAAGALGTDVVTGLDITCNTNPGKWGLPTCPLQANDSGTSTLDAISGGQFSADVDIDTGRGTFVNMKFPNDAGYCTGTAGFNDCGYAYYIVNKQELILISSDAFTRPANLTLWFGYRQLSSVQGWTLQQLDGKIITELTGVDSGNSDVVAGILNANGTGSATLSYDENDGGTLSQQQSAQGTYALGTNGQSTGNLTFTGFSQLAFNNANVYLYSGSTGFFVGSDAKVTSGVIESQATGVQFNNSIVNGSLMGGTVWPAVAGVTNSVTGMFADGAGGITATQYSSGVNGPSGPTNLTLTYSVDATGRAVINDSSGNQYGILYVVGPTKFVFLPVGNAPALSVLINGQPD